jgi:hypothetical protein
MPGLLYNVQNPISQAMGGMQGAASTAASMDKQGPQVEEPGKTVGGTIMNTAGGLAAGASTGALIGSAGGPIGATGGAAIGGLMGAASYLFS